MRDILGKLLRGKDGKDGSELPSEDSMVQSSQLGEPSGASETAIDGHVDNSMEETIEMIPQEKGVTRFEDDPAAVKAANPVSDKDDLVDTKPLSEHPQETVISPSRGETIDIGDRAYSLQAAHRCHVGSHRSRNEDSTFLFTAESGGEDPLLPFGLYIVADGMGGHHDGHKASKNVSRLVANYVLERIYLPLLEASIAPGSIRQEPILEVMLDAIQAANQRIFSPEPNKDSGTTLTAGLILGQRIYVAHVGDSRAYLLTDGKLTQVTTDHSYVQRLQDAGQLTEEEAAIHPQRNMLYQAVGQGGLLDVDTYTRSLSRDGMLILCSDGLWGLVNDTQLLNVLTSDIPLNSMADELVTLALYAGGHDNVSIVLADYNF